MSPIYTKRSYWICSVHDYIYYKIDTSDVYLPVQCGYGSHECGNTYLGYIRTDKNGVIIEDTMKDDDWFICKQGYFFGKATAISNAILV